MNILGLLQNTWADNSARVQATFDRATPKGRRAMIAYMLRQSRTGKRLVEVFGDWFNCIEWENASRVVTGYPGSRTVADLCHVQAILDEVKPSILLVFGKLARVAIAGCNTNASLIIGPHPARCSQQLLAQMKERLDDRSRHVEYGERAS